MKWELYIDNELFTTKYSDAEVTYIKMFLVKHGMDEKRFKIEGRAPNR